MGKLNDLELPQQPSKCAFGKLLNTLDADDRKILEDALDDPRWANRVLVEELGKRGLATSRDSLTHHRQGRCKCSKD